MSARVASANAVIAEVLRDHPRAVLTVSFGGVSGMVLLDLIVRSGAAIPVALVDTGVLFAETLELAARVERRYGINVVRVVPERTIEEQAQSDGPALWGRDPDRCCALRKVEPLRRFLADYDAWFTAIRRSQTENRARQSPIGFDAKNNVVKAAPLLDWTDDDVWAYVREHDVPVNVLHADGFPSLGCVPCTARVAQGEDARAGRWAGFQKTECGLHV